MRQNRSGIWVFGLACLAVTACTPFVGMSVLAPWADWSALDRTVFWSLRLPRTIAAFLAGGGLALCGMTFQALFRNPLADPFTLGIASGASCGAAVTILAGMTGVVFGVPVLSIGAFAGASLAMAMVYGLSVIRRSTSTIVMLLAGVAVSFLFSSILMFLQYMSSLRDSFHIIRWLMGGIEVFGYDSVAQMAPMVLAASAVVVALAAQLDHLLVGEDLAHTRGVNVRRTKNLLLACATLIVGSIVATCGPIGFVGLMIPHICRLMFGVRHQTLGPLCFVAGGAFLCVCDTVARTAIAPAEIPVGVITALLGGPFFLWLLFGARSEHI